MSSLNNAISQRRFKQINFLVNAGANLNSRNANGETALIQLCDLEPEEKAASLAKLLITKGAKVDVGDKKGRTALMRAILNGKGKLVTLFLEEILDFDLNAKDIDGNTALAHAAYVGNEKIVREIIQCLTKFGLTVDVRNQVGLTPLMIAAKNGHLSCVKVILNKGKACRYIRDDVKWKTALEWEKSRFQKTPEPQSGDIIARASPLSEAKQLSYRSSEKKEFRQLFGVYEEQLSTSYRKGYDNSKCTSLYKRLGFQTTQNNAENIGDSDLKNCSDSQARFLFAKSAAIIKFKRNGGLLNARKLVKKEGNCSSFPPGNQFLKENSKENIEKFESTKQKSSRLRRPVRCRSEIIYSTLKSDKVGEKERERTFHFSSSLPQILLQQPAVSSSKVLTVFEENDNIDDEKQTT